MTRERTASVSVAGPFLELRRFHGLRLRARRRRGMRIVDRRRFGILKADMPHVMLLSEHDARDSFHEVRKTLEPKVLPSKALSIFSMRVFIAAQFAGPSNVLSADSRRSAASSKAEASAACFSTGFGFSMSV